MALPGRSFRAEHTIWHGIVASTPVVTPLVTAFVIGVAGASGAAHRAHTRPSVIAPYAAQRAAASLQLEALVTPPQTQHVIPARTPRQRIHGSVQAPSVQRAAATVQPQQAIAAYKVSVITADADAPAHHRGSVIAPSVQQRAASQPVVTVTAPIGTVVKAARMEIRPRGSVIAPYQSQRAAASAALEALVTPPQVTHVVQAARSPRRPARLVVAPRPPGLIFTPPQTNPPRPTVISTVIPSKARRPHGFVITSYQSARGAASLILESAVTPPRTVTLVSLADQRRRVRGGAILEPRPLGLIFTPPQTNPPGPHVVITRTPPAPRRGAHLYTPYLSQRGAAATVLQALVTRPRPAQVLQGRRPRQIRPVGHVYQPRPTFITGGTPPSLGSLVLIDPSPFNHVVASTLEFGLVRTGTYTFSASYSSGGETFLIPAISEHVMVIIPHSQGFNFTYLPGSPGKIKAFTGAGVEVTGGTNLSTLGALYWLAICR